jgi:hypothetical protein
MRLLSTLTALLLIATIGVKAQECKAYIPAAVGTEIEMTSYDKKDKPTSIVKQTLKDVKQSGDSTIYSLHQVITDEKGKDPKENDYSFKCYDGTFYIDMKTFIDQKTLDSYKDMQMKITTKNLVFPSNLSAGQKLNDGYFKMEVMAGIMPITITIDVVNVKVEGFESITTSAGTFSCVKISEDVNSNFGFVKSKAHVITWYSDKVGTVRSEVYVSDKLNSYTVLTNYKK